MNKQQQQQQENRIWQQIFRYEFKSIFIIIFPFQFLMYFYDIILQNRFKKKKRNNEKSSQLCQFFQFELYAVTSNIKAVSNLKWFNCALNIQYIYHVAIAIFRISLRIYFILFFAAAAAAYQGQWAYYVIWTVCISVATQHHRPFRLFYAKKKTLIFDQTHININKLDKKTAIKLRRKHFAPLKTIVRIGRLYKIVNAHFETTDHSSQ